MHSQVQGLKPGRFQARVKLAPPLPYHARGVEDVIQQIVLDVFVQLPVLPVGKATHIEIGSLMKFTTKNLHNHGAYNHMELFRCAPRTCLSESHCSRYSSGASGSRSVRGGLPLSFALVVWVRFALTLL